MRSNPAVPAYSAREIALAAGVREDEVRACLAAAGYGEDDTPHAAAVRVGRLLVERARTASSEPFRASLFAIFGAQPTNRRAGVPLAVSGTLHAGFLAGAVFIAALGTASTAATAAGVMTREPLRLVFLKTPGPGGGGGGGGLNNPLPARKARSAGSKSISSPLPKRELPKPIVARIEPPEPVPQVLEADPLPALIAPIVQAPADMNTRAGALEQAAHEKESRGAGTEGGIGSGAGTGIADGQGRGVGPGSGGGTGGGPYRPGSGIEAPRLLKEVRADYTEEARQANVEGDVLLEIVVTHDGNVGDVRILRRLGSGLDQRAVAAVRQWRFAPARRLGAPVDVIVQVSVEFKLR
jgi:periplasmic protein TonB